jgi:hypothetical protein
MTAQQLLTVLINVKSSLKTFLAGKNPLVIDPAEQSKLVDSETLGVVSGFDRCGDNNTYYCDDGRWQIDVLDDGTAITYCATP